MSINGISPELLSAQNISGSSGSSGQNPRIAALERKLQRLNQEKKKAVENKDQDKARKLEQEIQAVKQQIQELKKKEEKKKKTDAPENPDDLAVPNDSALIAGLGQQVDQYA